MNKVIVIGNLGRDPDMHYAQNGTAVSRLNVAVKERVKQGEQWVDETEWVRVVCFGKTAENVGKHLAKGRQIAVEGRMRTRQYRDKDGVEKSSTEVVAERVQFLGAGGGQRGDARRDDPGAYRSVPTPQEASMHQPNAEPDGGFIDDDLPF